MKNDATRTTQLRRYVLLDGVMPSFLRWWHEQLVPARENVGFTIEFAYALPDSNEFVWAVSVPGDQQAFDDLEAAYLTSPQRAAAFQGIGPWTASADTSLVDVQA